MILKRIRKVINEFRSRDENRKLENERIKTQIAELEWAHIYHDTIRDKEWLQKLSLSPGRWAVNYSFLYILVRILTEYKPNKIIEFGLGESSKIISTFISNELKESLHLILEQNENWIELFRRRFALSVNSKIIHLPYEFVQIEGHPVTSYTGLSETVQKTFDLYVVDGPTGSDFYSRHDICLLGEHLERKSEFIIIIDDYERIGEQQTAADLINLLNKRGIKTHVGIYSGAKSQILIASDKYMYATSL